ncbi:MAG: prohibitin family protein [Elusimicrobia bacterium]|nr:prohibitin family protein [Elusimicrobiota bacterium]
MKTAPGAGQEKIIDIKSGYTKKKLQQAAVIILLLFGLVTLLKGIVIVPAGHRYVVFNIFRGVLDKELDEGLHVLLPYVNSTVSYEVRLQEYTMSSVRGEGRVSEPDSLWSPTEEGLQVGIDLTVLYRIDPDKVSDLHEKIGKNFESKIIRPAVRSIVRHNISEHKIMEVYSKSRKEIEDKVFSDLEEQMKKNYIIVEGVKLRDVIFTDKFAESIEQKQVAQQEMERWEYVKKQREKEADARIIEAKGKAEAMRIIAQQLRANPDIIKYNYVEKLSDDVQVIITDQSTIMDLKGILKDSGK